MLLFQLGFLGFQPALYLFNKVLALRSVFSASENQYKRLLIENLPDVIPLLKEPLKFILAKFLKYFNYS